MNHGLSISDIKGKEPMYNYFFEFANILMKIESEFEVKINKESFPFLKKDKNEYDIKIRFIPTESIESVASENLWIEDKLYTYQENVPVTYVRNYPGEPPYALIRYHFETIEIFYLKESENYVSSTHSILNLIGLEKILLDQTAILLHSSLIEYQGHGILFSAPCGVGKSTQANLWEKYKNSEILNGDRAGLRWNQKEWMAYGMPFAGTSGIYKNVSVPITAIVILEQNNENKIRRFTPMEAIRKLLPECSCRRWDNDFMNQLFDLLIVLVQKVPVYLLQCRPDEEAVEVLYNTLQQEELL